MANKTINNKQLWPKELKVILRYLEEIPVSLRE